MKKHINFVDIFKNDGTDPRKNDVWRIILFAMNNTSAIAIMNLMGKWPYFTQNVLRLGVFLSSVTIFTTLLDAITDPILASIFDNCQMKKGKFKRFMLIGCLLCVVPAIVIFFYPVEPQIPIWLTYTILILMYSIIVVGNTVMMTATRAGQAIITQDPRQRPIYSLGQTVFEAIVLTFVSFVITGDVIGKMQDPFVWKVAIVVLSVLSVVLVFVAVYAIKNRDNEKYYSMSTSKEKVHMREFAMLIKRNKPLRSLLFATASDSLAAGMRGTFTIYLFANIILQRNMSAMFGVISDMVLGLPILLIGLYLASKKGSAVVYTRISIFQTCLAVAGFFICLIFLPADPSRMYTGITFNILVTLIVLGIYVSTLGISSNLTNAMTGDLIDYEFYTTGKFIPGTIGATITFVNKAISSLVGVVVTLVMLYAGFSKVGMGSVVPENIFINHKFYYCIAISIFLFPAIGHFITYLAMRKYPLDDKKMLEVSLFIAKKRGLMEDSDTIE